MPTDFRDGKTFPRRGRTPLDGYLWLARVFDKGRAAASGTIHDYIYPCPMDTGVFKRWGVTTEAFDAAMRQAKGDDDILAWAREHVSTDARDAANRWLVTEKAANLDRQDREEMGG